MKYFIIWYDVWSYYKCHIKALYDGSTIVLELTDVMTVLLTQDIPNSKGLRQGCNLLPISIYA